MAEKRQLTSKEKELQSNSRSNAGFKAAATKKANEAALVRKQKAADQSWLKAADKAWKTATWARTMTKWLITHSSKDGVKWQLVEFNGRKGSRKDRLNGQHLESSRRKGQESGGIVDLIAIRKNHNEPQEGRRRGDLFEIVLIQVKGGSAPFPKEKDVKRLMDVKKYHQAENVVLAEWKKAKRLCLYEWEPANSTWDAVGKTWGPPKAKWKEVSAKVIFGKQPKISKKVLESTLRHGQNASATKKS